MSRKPVYSIAHQGSASSFTRALAELTFAPGNPAREWKSRNSPGQRRDPCLRVHHDQYIQSPLSQFARSRSAKSGFIVPPIPGDFPNVSISANSSRTLRLTKCIYVGSRKHVDASPHVRKAGRLKGGLGRFLSGRIDKHRLTGSEEDHRYPETHWRRSSLMIRYIAGLEPTESDNASLLPVPREQETGDCDGVMACSMHPQVGPYLVQGCESATRNDLCAWSGV
ncbi:hypothetical protein PCL_09048 [Purpureocillium lilacinum]|uniref:Uncharacterized protein n=1 Tax=Purpureocillium lilacinum TaxID=33203 RepID=A0A2U3EH28_PURLI|nr:hypothetical protein Purlil1_8409 [Purpureocillium lilacinum]PWI73772.1 hypothetical protein PCL_09048 [Purpureocillium lilacinum]